MKDNNIIIVLFFLLLFILIVVIVYNYFIDNNIEKFESAAMSTTYRIPDAKVTISSFKVDNPSFDKNKAESYFRTFNINETCLSSPDNKKYIVISSFNYSEIPNTTSLLVTLNKNNTTGIRLENSNSKTSYFKKIIKEGSVPVVGGNYICIFFEQNKLVLNNLTINASMQNINSTTVDNIKLFTGNDLEDDSYLQLDTKSSTDSNNNIVITVSDKEQTYISDNIIIYFPPEISQITLRKLDFIFNTVDDSDNSNYDSSRTDVMDTETSLPDPDALSYTNIDFTNVENFMKAFYLEVPDFIYDFDSVSIIPKQFLSYNIPIGQDGTISSIQDVFGRQRYLNVINGENPKLVYEYDNNNNLYGSYLQGSSRTNIKFPPGTIPDDYTICCVTKYQNTSGNNSGRILTADNFNFLIGHWGSREGTIYNERKSGGWIKYHDNIVNNNPNSRKWVVTCLKSRGNNNIIINNVKIPGEGGPGLNSACMAINGFGRYSGEVSDFGIKYIFIWKKSLRDDIFQLISDGLNGMISSGKNYFNLKRDKITMNFKDGLSPSSAADSAKQIKDIYGTEKNGFYYINIPGKGPKYTYCIMDSACYGGGWMLALQGARNSTKFVFRSKLWTEENKLNTIENNNGILDNNPSLRTFVNPSTGDPILENIIDAKYHIYNYYPCNSCLALFPGSHTNGGRTRIPGKPQYGWNWYSNGAFGKYGTTTLLDFFSKNRRSYQYTSIRSNFKRQIADPSDEGEFMPMPNVIAKLNDEMPLGIWARQTTYFAYGLNITLSKYCWWANRVNGPYLINGNHQVRWGAVFNENDGDDYSPDVSGGIGLDISSYTGAPENNTYAPYSSAGNRVTCCAVGGSPVDVDGCLRFFGYKLFRRKYWSAIRHRLLMIITHTK